jgi:hypothetical protein
MFCATCAMRQLRRDVEVAAVFVQRAVEQGKQAGLAGAVAPHQADLFAGVDGDADAPSSSTLAPRRR